MATVNDCLRTDDNKFFKDIFNKDGYRFPFRKAGVRLFADVRFPVGMTDSEIGKMTILSKEMIGKTNMLGYRQNEKIIPYTALEIGCMVGLSGSRARAFTNKMRKLHIMQKVLVNGDPQYYINPAYFMASGQRLTLDLFLLFRNELTNIIPDWVMKSFLAQAREKKVSRSTNVFDEFVAGMKNGNSSKD